MATTVEPSALVHESGADDLANVLLPSLTAGRSFVVPATDLNGPLFAQPPTSGASYLPVQALTAKDLTTGEVGGTGMFDQLMVSLVNHLKVEYTANRISGAEYTKAYIAAVGAALQSAQQYLLAKDQSYYAALLVQQQVRVAEIEAIKARVELETAKAMYSKTQFEAYIAEAQYGLTKMQISNADAEYAGKIAQTAGVLYTNANLLPAQLDQAKAQTATITYTNTNLLPAQLAHTQAETTGTVAQTAGVTYTNANLLPAQLAATKATTDGTVYTTVNILPAQKTKLDRENANLALQGTGLGLTNTSILPAQATLIKEQGEVQRAQTLDKRSDTATVTGAIGKQKELYQQQITSYVHDSENKFVKMYADSFMTQLTINEGLKVPEQFDESSINTIMLELRKKLGFTSV